MELGALTDPVWILLIAGAIAVGLAVGVSGFGDALVGSAIWLHVFTPEQTVPLVLLASLVVHAASFPALRKDFSLSRSGRFLIPGVIGVPVGGWLLLHMDPRTVKSGLGVLLVVIGLLLLTWQRRVKRGFHSRPADTGVGFVGGVMGGFAGLSGVLPTLYVSTKDWTQGQQRAVYQPFIFVMNLLALIVLVSATTIAVQTWLRFAVIVPPLLLGWFIGLRLYRRVDALQFRRIVLGLIIVSGLSLAL